MVIALFSHTVFFVTGPFFIFVFNCSLLLMMGDDDDDDAAMYLSEFATHNTTLHQKMSLVSLTLMV